MRPLRTSVSPKVTREDFQDRSQVPFPKGSPPKRTDADMRHEVIQLTKIGEHGKVTQERTPNQQTTKGAPKTTRSRTGRPRFPLNNFKYFLTLFSKFFSSFPHGTCTLSVSPQYLALDETYHLIRAALPSNPTLWTWCRAQGPHAQRRDSHPL
jgi:hypothetical protein